MITEAKLREITCLVARFHHPKITRQERQELYVRLVMEYGVMLESNLARTSD